MSQASRILVGAPQSAAQRATTICHATTLACRRPNVGSAVGRIKVGDRVSVPVNPPGKTAAIFGTAA
ncbi:MAG: hypothetical protein M3Y89_17450 [Actinomycetota bacterium]|nr:hypothetical protein [Actinomycetota bacterium]